MTENDHKYLIFYVGQEAYGCPLLSIREVLEYQKPMPMPNMKSYFSGVINVRGAIVGVVDLRAKLGLNAPISGQLAMLMCDTEKGAVAAIVDRVDSVQQFEEVEVEKKVAVKASVPASYLTGIAKRDKNMIVLVNLFELLSEDELKAA